jgi:hypothetical protein
LLGIALLLFFEDLKAGALAAEALDAEAFVAEVLDAEALSPVRVSLEEAPERLLVALRLAADAFLAALETLFLRVFCDTACAWETATPLFVVLREPVATKSGKPGLLNVPNIAHFPQKSMIYDDS